MLARRRHGQMRARCFVTDRFLRENAFRPDTLFFFANHHAATCAECLFHTDWNDALIYTADGIGDNISYRFGRFATGAFIFTMAMTRCCERRTSHNSLADGLWFCHDGMRLPDVAARRKADRAFGAREPTLGGRDRKALPSRCGRLIEAGLQEHRIMVRRSSRYVGACRENIRHRFRRSRGLILQAVRHWIDDEVARGSLRFAAGSSRMSGSIAAGGRSAARRNLYLSRNGRRRSRGRRRPGLPAGTDGLPMWLAQRRRLDNVYLGHDYDEGDRPMPWRCNA